MKYIVDGMIKNFRIKVVVIATRNVKYLTVYIFFGYVFFKSASNKVVLLY